MDHCRCGPGARWCALADALFDVPGMHVLEVHREPDPLVLTVESDADVGGCPSCGVVAVEHGRRVHEAADAPCFGVATRVRWRKRIWRCAEVSCPRGTFSEKHPFLAAPAKLTSRAVAWATDALAEDDTIVSAWRGTWGWTGTPAGTPSRSKPGGDWPTPPGCTGVRTVGVDEHAWRPSRIGDTHRAATAMVDLTRDEDGHLHARLLDVVPGRSGSAYTRWLQAQTEGFVAGIEHAALDPFRGYANALRDELPDAVAVLDAFHVVKLGTQVIDEVRRRVQQETLGRRGHKDDPLYKIRGLLRRGREQLTDKQITRLNDGLHAGDADWADWEVSVAWHAYQQLRSIYTAPTATSAARSPRK